MYVMSQQLDGAQCDVVSLAAKVHSKTHTDKIDSIHSTTNAGNNNYCVFQIVFAKNLIVMIFHI